MLGAVTDISEVRFKRVERFKGVIKNGEKLCAKCKHFKLLEKFSYSKLNVDGLHSYCKECVAAIGRHIYRRKTGRTIEEIEDYKASRIIKIIDGKKICNICSQWKLVSCFIKNDYQKSGLEPSCKGCNNKRLRSYRFKETRRIKLICMMGYGGKCVCCGENKIELLTIEHIRGKWYKLIYDMTVILMKKLISLNFPKGYTVLCYNCNLSSVHSPCVHSKERLEYYNKNIKPYNYSRQRELDELERKWAMMNSVGE